MPNTLKERVEALEAKLANVTPAPWGTLHGDVVGVHQFIPADESETGKPGHRYMAVFDTEEDEIAVAALRNDAPPLLRALLEANEKLREQLAEVERRAGLKCGCGAHHWVCHECTFRPVEAQLTAAQEDTARLDWFGAETPNGLAHTHIYAGECYYQVFCGGVTIRQAIDEARATTGGIDNESDTKQSV